MLSNQTKGKTSYFNTEKLLINIATTYFVDVKKSELTSFLRKKICDTHWLPDLAVLSY